MQRMPARDEAIPPKPQQASRSFSRYDPLSTRATSRTRSDSDHEYQKTATTGSPAQTSSSIETAPERSHSDVFETQDDQDSAKDTDASGDDASREDFEDLPIELRSLVERFLESLPLKAQTSSLSIDRYAELYQNFYTHVSSQIATHIATLQSRISRDKSPAPSVSSASSAASRNGPRRKTRGLAREPEQQMLTASEVTNRKKARRQLELRRLWMEEAVERRVCERAYSRIWRNSSTDDESRDAKLKSRAAALSLIGIDLKELLSTAMASSDAAAPEPIKKDSLAYSQLTEARKSLEQMNDAKYPQGKLQALSTVHKDLVDALQQMYPSSSSADEILPTLIFVIITSHPESVNIVSDLLFIQRFRDAEKLAGEAAYCLTNLEAAIGFLETVDLSSIRSSEQPTGPPKNGTPNDSRPLTPRSDGASPDPLYRGLPGSPTNTAQTSAKPTSPRHSRRLSSLMGARPQPLPGAVLTQADNAIDALHTALDTSFQYLFGRMKERQAIQSPTGVPELAAPRTLEDARKLVTEKSDDDPLADEEASLNEGSEETRKPARDDMLSLIGGRRPLAESSVSSAQSDGSAAKKGPAAVGASSASAQRADSTGLSAANLQGSAGAAVASGYAAVESVRNFGDSLNPFKGFTVRGFGRPTTPAAAPASREMSSSDAKAAVAVDSAANSSSKESQPGVDVSGIGPPIERFVDLKDARELNHFDVELLLRDYQRLAGVFRVLQST